jgi:S1-C subfamily serine protease
VDLFRRASPSVVFITTLDRVVNLFSMNVREVPRGTGSGFIWDEAGHVVTNYHVIAGARGAQVRLADQRSFAAELVGVSPENDLAVLRIKPGERRPAPLPLGSSTDLRVGQRVLAIGNPFGFDHTLTTGVISALDRSISDDEGAIHHLIQTDAAINPGNSGGPLLDSAGRLIGVNTSIYSPSGASAGIGFAIPADTVNRVVPEIIATGRYERAVLGIVSTDNLSELVTRQLGVKGMLVVEVQPRTPAAEAGLRGTRVGRDGSVDPGDVIQSVDGRSVTGSGDFDRLMDGKRPGDAVALGLWRNGKTLSLTIRLGRR